jgi:IMP dehydrogenase
MKLEGIPIALTFDDVLLVPCFSSVLPSDTDVTTFLAPGIELNIPLVSAAMDTVTESDTAICMAREGGIGIIHRNLSVTDQVKEVRLVKREETGMIIDPLVVGSDQRLGDAIALMRDQGISGLPVVKDGKPIGILTNRDIRFEKNLNQQVGDVMTQNLIKIHEGFALEEAKDLLHRYRIEKIIVIDEEGYLKGMVTTKDIEKSEKYPLAVKDRDGCLCVGAAVGVGSDREERVSELVKAGCDMIVVDTAHGHSKMVIDAVADIRTQYPALAIMAGNVATGEACEALIDAGAYIIKVGIGPGSICTTRIVSGVGVPQVTAIHDCVSVAKRRGATLVADGGIRFSGDVAKAIAVGANAVMIGSLFAGTDEAPGEKVLFQGRRYKTYRGMGSVGAMREGSRDRYFQSGVVQESKLVPEGIEGRIPYRGQLSESIYQLVGGLRSAMGYVGCGTIDSLRKECKFVRVTSAGRRESHVHDVDITKEAPNYFFE